MTQSDDDEITIDFGDDFKWTDMNMGSSVHDDNVVTITSSSDSGTISIYDSILTGGTDTITFDTFSTPNTTLHIGDTVVTEEMICKLDALVRAIENLPEDNELRTMFESVLILKKLKNED